MAYTAEVSRWLWDVPGLVQAGNGSLGNGPMSPGPHSQTGPHGPGFVLTSEQDQAGLWGPGPRLPVSSSPLRFPAHAHGPRTQSA